MPLDTAKETKLAFNKIETAEITCRRRAGRCPSVNSPAGGSTEKLSHGVATQKETAGLGLGVIGDFRENYGLFSFFKLK